MLDRGLLLAALPAAGCVSDSDDENEDGQEGDDDVELVETDYQSDDDDKSDKNINGWTYAVDSDGNSESDLMHEF